MFRLLPALVLLFALVAPAAASEMDDATAAYESGDYAGAARRMRALAESGDAKAQYALGAMYVQGLGVPQNNAQAMMWFQRAAAQGDARARYNLSVMYSTSQNGRQTYAAVDPWTD